MSPASSMRITLVLLSASSTVRTIRSSDASCWRSSRSTSQATGPGPSAGRRPSAAGRTAALELRQLCQPVLGIGRALARQLGHLLDGRRPEDAHGDRGRAPRFASCPLRGRPLSVPRPALEVRDRSAVRQLVGGERRELAAQRPVAGRTRQRGDETGELLSRRERRSEPMRAGAAAGARASSGSFGWSVQGRTTSPGSSRSITAAVTGSPNPSM